MLITSVSSIKLMQTKNLGMHRVLNIAYYDMLCYAENAIWFSCTKVQDQ